MQKHVRKHTHHTQTTKAEQRQRAGRSEAHIIRCLAIEILHDVCPCTDTIRSNRIILAARLYTGRLAHCIPRNRVIFINYNFQECYEYGVSVRQEQAVSARIRACMVPIKTFSKPPPQKSLFESLIDNNSIIIHIDNNSY